MTLKIEEWRDIDGYNGDYQVSNTGRVRSRKYGDWRIMKPGRSGPPGKDYPFVCLYVGAKMTQRKVHHLVLEAFVSHRPSSKHHACHNDGDRFNSELSNLRWDTRSENEKDKVRHGTNTSGERASLAKLCKKSVREIRTRLLSGEKQRSLATEFGVSQSVISFVKNHKTWKHVEETQSES